LCGGCALYRVCTVESGIGGVERTQVLQTLTVTTECKDKKVKRVHFSFVVGGLEGTMESDSESDPGDPLHNPRNSSAILRSVFSNAQNRHLCPMRFTVTGQTASFPVS